MDGEVGADTAGDVDGGAQGAEGAPAARGGEGGAEGPGFGEGVEVT